jgi:membrane associated rhomboid family serine protease
MKKTQFQTFYKYSICQLNASQSVIVFFCYSGHRESMFLPFRDHNPPERKPFITYGLILINIAVFFSYWGSADAVIATQITFERWAMFPEDIRYGVNLYSMISSIFLHGGILHLASNMLFLYIYGDNLEDELGHMTFLGFYLTCGVLANVAQVLADPASNIPVVGASGAIAGVMGGYLLLFPKAKIDILVIFVIFFRVFSISAWIVLGLWFALQLFNGATSTAVSSGVAYWAHIGGFAAGVFLIIPLFVRLGATAYWSQTFGHPPHPDKLYAGSTTRVPLIPRKSNARK